MGVVETRQLLVDEQPVILTIRRSARRKRRLSLSLQADGNALLQVPLRTSRKDIDMMLSRHRLWLSERRQQWREHRKENPPLILATGEVVSFQGRTLSLQINQRPGCAAVSLNGGYLEIAAGSVDTQTLANALQRWYRRQAEQRFPSRLEYWSRQLPWVDETPTLRLRKMRSRWGSCSADGRLCLNTELIKHRSELLDYVIVHELCHLQEFNHSPRFYRLMASVMPEWRQHRDALKGIDLRRPLQEM